MDYPNDAAEAVANGAQLLDEMVPGWWRLIDLEILDLACCDACVCGQVAATQYSRLLFEEEKANGSTNPYIAFNSWAYWSFIEKANVIDWFCGFNECDEVWNKETFGVEGPSRPWSFEMLDDEWRSVIQARLEADLLTPVETIEAEEREVVPA